MVDVNKSPYYDDYDPAKKYTQLLAVPGRAEQAREFTQVQTLLLDFLKRLANTQYSEGNIVSGMSLSVKDNVATVQDGLVYLDGLIHIFSKQSIDITGEGLEEICVKLDQTIVTEVQDPSLREPAEGFDNYGEEGAHRIKSDPKLTLNDPTSPVVCKLMDGQLYIDTARPQSDALAETLARRTYDESGNYKVSGLTLWSEDRNDEEVTLNVEAGKAYVMGFEIIKPTSSKVIVPKSLSTRTVQNEPRIYSQNVTTYEISNYPVKVVTSLEGTVEVVEEQKTRGSVPGGKDYLNKTPVVEITSVHTKDPSTGEILVEYVQGRDYQLTGNQTVDWSLNFGNSIEPDGGTTYYVTYKYNKTFVQGTDYNLSREGNKDYIKFLSGGDRPVLGTQFRYDYEFFLARKDLISLDKNGDIRITTGQSDTADQINTPVNNDPELLHLGTIYLPPNSGDCITNSYAITRIRMEDLQDAINRLNDVEYNQAISALDEEALSGEPVTQLKGVFSDSFTSVTKGDTVHPEFSIAYSLEDGEIYLPTKATVPSQPAVLAGNLHKVWGRLVTSPVTEVAEIQQTFSTKVMLVNPYNVFNKMAILKLDPAVDNWVEETNILIEKVKFETVNLRRLWAHQRNDYNAKEKEIFDNIKWDDGSKNYSGAWREVKTGSVVEKTRQVVEESITYMRQRDVEIEASNLIPFADNLEVYFDGRLISVKPSNSKYQGTISGTLKADSEGVAKGKFTVPSGVRTGTREVVIKNSQNTGTGSYTANGLKRTVTDTILTRRITATLVDPLAQSFQFDSNRMVASVGLYFAKKDPTLNATIQIRNMVNGYPGQIVYGETVLTPSDINVSDKGTIETRVWFDDPILCEANTQYCVVVLTDSSITSMHVAELGGKDLNTGEVVSRQPLLSGTLFSSSNAITWTAHQTEDMKFNVYTCRFAEKGVVEFEPFNFEDEINTDSGVDRLILLADYLTMESTGCSWEMKIDDGSYQPISAYEDKDLLLEAKSIQLRATFESNIYVSPILALDSFSLVGFLTALEGSYISRNIQMSQKYTTVKQSIEAYVPSGSSVVPKFSYDNTNWFVGTLVDETQVTNEFTRFTYEYQVPSEANAINFRARVDMSAESSWIRPRARKFINVIK
ncbi:gp16.2 [Bacillus phage SPO1]|uniref:Gp16.2 n=1 Tax=Bacillus phage SP01 TaxID=2884427 RepID=B6V2Q7_BPSP1|nr:gp16.2 [Bacillus phage SPO1]ACI90998.1 gp16.2 [Bacillus phage SPO1]